MSPSPTSMRQASALACGFLLLAGTALPGWRWLQGSRPEALELAICAALPVLGLVIALTPAPPRQLMMRLVASLAMLPILLLFWGSELPGPPAIAEDRPFWPFALAFCLAHALFFVAFILWAGMRTTEVPPAPDATPVTPALLAARLQSLSISGLPLKLSHEAGGVWRLDRTGLAEGRSHTVRLRLCPQQRQVQVRETVRSNAADPADEEEASLRGPGDERFDPTRPRADKVWRQTAQTTMIEPERLAALRLGLRDGQVDTLDTRIAGDGFVTLLCAVVTRSGWHWQPVFWFAKP